MPQRDLRDEPGKATAFDNARAGNTEGLIDHENLLRRPAELSRLGDQGVLARGRFAIVLDLCRTGLSEIDISEAGEMRGVDLGEITHRPSRFGVAQMSRGSVRSRAQGSHWLWRGLRARAPRPALLARRAARE